MDQKDETDVQPGDVTKGLELHQLSGFKWTEASDEQREEALREAFDLFDTDHDGSIDIQELGTLMRTFGRNPTLHELRKIMETVDTNANGVIDFPEFVTLMKDELEQEETDEEFLTAFRTFDKDGDGKITRDELLTVLTSMGDDRMSKAQAEAMLAQADTNGDGVIDYEEFVMYLLSAQ